jgi:hypothetical protein
MLAAAGFFGFNQGCAPEASPCDIFLQVFSSFQRLAERTGEDATEAPKERCRART